MEDTPTDINNEKTNTKIFVTALISVLAGTAFVLALVAFGMGMQRKFDSYERAKAEANREISIIKLEYEAKGFGYQMTEESRSLLQRLGAAEGEKSVTIDTNDRLEEVLGVISEYAGKKPDYKVDADFFESGSVILVATEAAGLKGFSVNSVSRDEDYNVQIDTAKTTTDESEIVSGQLIFVMIQNIQPASVTVNID